jgi:hypothetical protein
MEEIRCEGVDGLDSPGSDYGPQADSCENGDEPSGSVKDREFVDQLSDSQLLNAPWS